MVQGEALRLAENWVQIAAWSAYPWLRHGFSTRQGGASRVYLRDEPAELKLESNLESGLELALELNLGFTPEDDQSVIERNRLHALEAVGGRSSELATMRQVHGTTVLAVTGGGLASQADGLVTENPGVMLGVMTADCVPILVADVRQRIVGAFHAGWRGTAEGIAGVGVARMLAMGARGEDLVAAIGPSIGPCCYQVGEEVKIAFLGKAEDAPGLFGGDLLDRLDLWESNRRQLAKAGVPEDQIRIVSECTACMRLPDGRRKYFSHRAENGRTGRAMSLIGISSDRHT